MYVLPIQNRNAMIFANETENKVQCGASSIHVVLYIS